MSDDWQIDMESRLAHQENTVDQLNAVLTAQQLEIEELRRTCTFLFEKLNELEELQQQGTETKPPPHY